MKRINFHLEKRGFATVAAGAALAATLTATMTSGVSYANSGTPQGLPPGAVSADGKFFTPGSNTIVKRNAGEATPGKLSTESLATVNPGPAGTAESYWLKNARRTGQSCGTGLLAQTSGNGKTTLVLTVEKSVAATVTKEIGVDYKAISAGMGWSVTNSYTVKNETRYEVPAGKWGSVQAFPLYDVYRADVYRLFGSDTGKDVYAYKPVGVCFNSWNQ
ncbi:hypothetical protein ACFXEL_34430 [Streptomyces sp. NPDC059382]|uniref:hypothetical protein n=1 Tax=Streptomyces sp. NPDC059382 TaxID=3346816 RepID=UPI00367E01D3